MTHVPCESKLRLVVRSSMHPCRGDWVIIGRVVGHYARAAHAFSAGIKCRHCILTTMLLISGMECYRPLTFLCCQKERCKDKQWVENRRKFEIKFWKKCLSDPNCKIPGIREKPSVVRHTVQQDTRKDKHKRSSWKQLRNDI